MTADQKACPRCAETVKRAALVCRYCGHEFGEVEAAAPAAEPVQPGEGARPASKGRVIGLSLFGLILVLAALGQCNPGSRPTITQDETLTTDLDVSSPGNAEGLDNMLDAPSDALGASTPTVEATASAVPSFDTDRHCREVSEVGGTGSYAIEETCRNMEADARSELAGRSIPDRVYQHCKEVAEVGGAGSYSIMNTCVDMELGAAGRL